jgi:hypothetical protein
VTRSHSWGLLLGGCVALRLVVPLAVLVAAPDKLPLTPSYTFTPLNGDSYDYYHAVTNLDFAASKVFNGWLGVACLALLACFGVAGELVRRSGMMWLAISLWTLGPSLVLGLLAHDMAGPGAGVIGWPLVWAFATLPLPILRLATTPDRAFAFGLAVSLAANAFTVIATAVVGRRLSGRRSVGILAAALLASWPLWMSLVAGTQAFQNGQWNVDVGLHLYTEPVSTALVAAALLLLTAEPVGPTVAVLAGLALGFSTVVKLTDGLIAAAVVAIVAIRESIDRAVLVALGGLISLPILVGYWAHGYANDNVGVAVPAGGRYQWRFVHQNLNASTIFTPWMLILLLPLAAIGLASLPNRYGRALLVVPIGVTVIAYATYFWTAQHPRFFYVVMPALFILQAAGIVRVLKWALPEVMRRLGTDQRCVTK